MKITVTEEMRGLAEEHRKYTAMLADESTAPNRYQYHDWTSYRDSVSRKLARLVAEQVERESQG